MAVLLGLSLEEFLAIRAYWIAWHQRATARVVTHA